jgi:hypothetical protein
MPTDEQNPRWNVGDRATVNDDGWGKPAEITILNITENGIYIERSDGAVALVNPEHLSKPRSSELGLGQVPQVWDVFHMTSQRWAAAIAEVCDCCGEKCYDPDEILQPGWYVIGGEYPPEPDAVISIEYAWDSEGADATQRVAHAIKAALNTIATNSSAGKEQDDDGIA